MKKITQITAFLAALMLSAGAMADPVTFGDGGTSLRGIFNGLATDGLNDVDVNEDQVDGDELWEIGASGGSTAVIVVELAGNSETNRFGIYDASNPTNTVELFAGADGAGASVQFCIQLTGVYVDGCTPADTPVALFPNNLFGFYLSTVGGTFYSDPMLNPGEADHMASYQGIGEQIQLPGNFPGAWAPNEFILAWEDLNVELADFDYNDFVVFVESVNPVPAPGTLVLLGMALAGLGMSRRRKA